MQLEKDRIFLLIGFDQMFLLQEPLVRSRRVGMQGGRGSGENRYLPDCASVNRGGRLGHHNHTSQV